MMDLRDELSAGRWFAGEDKAKAKQEQAEKLARLESEHAKMAQRLEWMESAIRTNQASFERRIAQLQEKVQHQAEEAKRDLLTRLQQAENHNEHFAIIAVNRKYDQGELRMASIENALHQQITEYNRALRQAVVSLITDYENKHIDQLKDITARLKKLETRRSTPALPPIQEMDATKHAPNSPDIPAVTSA